MHIPYNIARSQINEHITLFVFQEIVNDFDMNNTFLLLCVRLGFSKLLAKIITSCSYLAGSVL